MRNLVFNIANQEFNKKYQKIWKLLKYDTPKLAMFWAMLFDEDMFLKQVLFYETLEISHHIPKDVWSKNLFQVPFYL